MKKCVFAGTFDPVTKGHDDIIAKCSKLFDEVVVALCINVKKSAMFSVETRIDMLEAVAKKYKNVKINTEVKKEEPEEAPVEQEETENA